MEMQAIFTYCLCCDILKMLGVKDDRQCKMTSAEIMTFLLVSATHFQANFRKTRLVVRALKFFTHLISESSMNRKIREIPEEAWILVFQVLSKALSKNRQGELIVDGFPVPCCQKNKIGRGKLFCGKEYIGFAASKKTWFRGIKVHLITTLDGTPLECQFTPGCEADVRALKNFSFDFPPGTVIYGDRAYSCYQFEPLLLEASGIRLVAKRKKNSRRPHSGPDNLAIQFKRNRIETCFSRITNFMPRCIRAVTATTFYLKIFLFILCYMLNRVCPLG